MQVKFRICLVVATLATIFSSNVVSAAVVTANLEVTRTTSIAMDAGITKTVEIAEVWDSNFMMGGEAGTVTATIDTTIAGVSFGAVTNYLQSNVNNANLYVTIDTSSASKYSGSISTTIYDATTVLDAFQISFAIVGTGGEPVITPATDIVLSRTPGVRPVLRQIAKVASSSSDPVSEADVFELPTYLDGYKVSVLDGAIFATLHVNTENADKDIVDEDYFEVEVTTEGDVTSAARVDFKLVDAVAPSLIALSKGSLRMKDGGAGMLAGVSSANNAALEINVLGLTTPTSGFGIAIEGLHVAKADGGDPCTFLPSIIIPDEIINVICGDIQADFSAVPSTSISNGSIQRAEASAILDIVDAYGMATSIPVELKFETSASCDSGYDRSPDNGCEKKSAGPLVAVLALLTALGMRRRSSRLR